MHTIWLRGGKVQPTANSRGEKDAQSRLGYYYTTNLCIAQRYNKLDLNKLPRDRDAPSLDVFTTRMDGTVNNLVLVEGASAHGWGLELYGL